MTCLEKLRTEHPEKLCSALYGGASGCPYDYGYLGRPSYCSREGDPNKCAKCWNREMPESPKILDSGNRREFETGAVRDIQEGKGRCDLLPLDVVAGIYGRSILDYIAAFMDSGETRHLERVLSQCIFDEGIFDSVYDMLLEVAKHFEEGCKKYGENNWQKGIPAHCYIDSAVRHYLKYLRGDKDEPHDRAFVWNLLCCIWTCKHKPELNDYARPEV